MLVSIITPAFNVEPFLADLVTSVLSQDLDDWEWIIIDDGSTDRTAELVRKLEDERIILISQKNQGAASARNAALDIASGKYITFLDADDLLTDHSLSSRVSYLQSNPDVDILNGAVQRFGANGDLAQYEPKLEKCRLFPYIIRLDEEVFLGIVYMIKRSSVGAKRFATGISHCEDLIFFTELAHDQDLIYGGIETCVYRYRTRDGSAMSDLDGLEAGYHKFVRRALQMTRTTVSIRLFLKWRISLIMIKTWLRQGRPVRAAISLARTLSVH